MFLRLCIYTFFLFAVLSLNIAAQNASPPFPGADNATERTEMPKNMRERLQRQRQEKEKRDYEEMVKRGETASQLAEQLHSSYSKSNVLTNSEIKKLDQLEKLVVRIRKDLGGGSDDKDRENEIENDPSTVKEVIENLKQATSDLFEELKKTSRFSISAVAIQSSNSIIRLARFLRRR